MTDISRRHFLKLSLLVPLALSTKLQVEPEKFEIISDSHKFKTIDQIAFSPSKAWEEMGKRAMEGYVEGVQAHSLPWDEMPKGLKVTEVEWTTRPVRQWGNPYLKPKYGIEALDRPSVISPENREVLKKLAEIRNASS